MKHALILFASLALMLPASATLFDGTITEGTWTLIDDNTGGPGPGFGAGHEINALYASGNASQIHLGLAGNVQAGNSIVLFLDTIAGGYTDGNYGRDSAPAGIATFNSGTTFDTGFEADFALRIGTDGIGGYFWNLFTLSGTDGSGGGPDNFLGSAADPDLAADPVNGDLTRGFEFAIDKTDVGYTGGDIQVFATYVADDGTLSNQFISPAGSGDGNYGSGAVTFGAAAPDPVTIPANVIPEPSTFMLLGLGLITFLRLRNRG